MGVYDSPYFHLCHCSIIMYIFPKFARILIVGKSCSGKSCLTEKLIRKQMLLFESPPEHILYVSPTAPPFLKQLPEVQWVTDIPEKTLRKTLYIIDDYMLNSTILSKSAHIATKTCHHEDSNLIFITQRLFNDDKFYRIICDNVTGMIIFKNPRGHHALSRLSSEIYPKHSVKYFWDSYFDATNREYGHLYIDLSSSYDLKSNLFTDIAGPNGIVQFNDE